MKDPTDYYITKKSACPSPKNYNLQATSQITIVKKNMHKNC